MSTLLLQFQNTVLELLFQLHLFLTGYINYYQTIVA